MNPPFSADFGLAPRLRSPRQQRTQREIMDSTSPTSAYAARTPPPAVHTAAGSNGGRHDEPYYFEPFGDDGLTFGDILDVVNPLQHIPIVSTLYREWTGDGIDPVPRIAGGALFGGIAGAIASLVNVVVDEITGSDIGEHVYDVAGDLLGIGDDDPAEMYAGANGSPGGDPDALPLGTASGNALSAVSSLVPVTTAADVFEWPRRAANPAFGATLSDVKGEAKVGALEREMASVRQGQVTEFMIMAMSMYEKGDHTATERVMPKIDILG